MRRRPPRGVLLAACAAAIASSFACPARAQDGDDAPQPSAYRPMGAPVDPKVPVHWNRYHDHGAQTRILEALAAAYPDLCDLRSLGDSYGGRAMWRVAITDPATGSHEEKPAFYVDGGIHANELQGPEVALYTAWFLLESHGKNAYVTRLLRERAFYIVPMLSPDGRDHHMTQPNTTHSPRSGLRPVDDDRDGEVDEDPPDDLDGDGSITRMRVADPQGRMKPHPRYPNLMVEAEPDESGSYTLLGWEGVDNDGDGRINEDGPGFYDPNRDWAWDWQPPYVQWGAHRYPFSIGENRLVADFVMAHDNIAGAQSYHNSGGMILRPPGVKGRKLDRSDKAVLDAIARRGEAMLPGYRYLEVATGLYEVYGGEFDWFYGMRGVVTFTNELFTSFNLFRKEGRSREDAHAFDRYLLFGEGIVEWKQVEHPFYGTIEVGGLRKEWMRQPPSFLLEEECHRNMAFTLYHADQMPLLEAPEVSVRPLDGGLREVTATVRNGRMIPTRTAHDVNNGITAPDLIEIAAAEGSTVLCGLVSKDRWFLDPAEQKREPARLRIPTVPGMGAVHVRWLVEGPGPITVTIRSKKGGTHATTVE